MKLRNLGSNPTKKFFFNTIVRNFFFNKKINFSRLFFKFPYATVENPQTQKFPKFSSVIKKITKFPPRKMFHSKNHSEKRMRKSYIFNSIIAS